MRLKKPRPASLDEVRITREGDTAVIDYVDPSIAGISLLFGRAALAELTDTEVLEQLNAALAAQAERAASMDRTLVEVPPGRPQIEYDKASDQWMPRGEVLRCYIENAAEDSTLILIDDVELDMAAFGRLLTTYAGFGMRIAFVDEDDIAETPEIVVMDPDDQ